MKQSIPGEDKGIRHTIIRAIYHQLPWTWHGYLELHLKECILTLGVFTIKSKGTVLIGMQDWTVERETKRLRKCAQHPSECSDKQHSLWLFESSISGSNDVIYANGFTMGKGNLTAKQASVIATLVDLSKKTDVFRNQNQREYDTKIPYSMIAGIPFFHPFKGKTENCQTFWRDFLKPSSKLLEFMEKQVKERETQVSVRHSLNTKLPDKSVEWLFGQK